MNRSNLEINHFTDYRSFLLAYVDECRRRKKTWSLGMWSKQLELKDSSSIRKILKGDREPGKEISKKLISFFSFSEKEKDYFLDLIRLTKIKDDPRLGAILLEKIGKKHPDKDIRHLDFETYATLSNWYTMAIKEMVQLKHFFEDPKWIAEQFRFKLTWKEAQSALNLLLKTNILTRDENGVLVLSDDQIRIGDDTLNKAVQQYHFQMLSRAQEALEVIDPSEREFRSMTFSMKMKNMPKAKELIKNFQRDFLNLLEEDGDDVVQLQMQLFPLTKSIDSLEEQ